MSDALFNSSPLPGNTEAFVERALPESKEHSAPALAPIERALDRSDTNAPLKITGEQTISTADELRETLAQHLDRGLDVVLDLSEVDECDTAALQLIYALRQSAIKRRQRFHITAVSPAIAKTSAAPGLHLEALTAACGPASPNGEWEMAGEVNGI